MQGHNIPVIMGKSKKSKNDFAVHGTNFVSTKYVIKIDQ